MSEAQVPSRSAQNQPWSHSFLCVAKEPRTVSEASPPLRLVLEPQGNASKVWLEAAAYFGLSSDRPRESL